MAPASAQPVRALRRSDPPPKPTGERATFLADVVAGLARVPKTLPARYMFDGVGTRLFACLAASEDHYLTRCELEILTKHAEELGAAIGEDAASQLAAALAATRTDLPILAAGGPEPAALRIPRLAHGSRTVAYLPASIIGSVEPRDAKTELRRLAVECGAGGGLLVSVDLKKDPSELERAYDDKAGIAASFGRNLLARINRELAGSFQLDAFDHRAVYDCTKGRVELQLVSKRWQWAAVHGQWVNFGAGEAITTLVAYKYTLEWFSSLATSAGWTVERVFTDQDRKYALILLRT